MCFLRPARPWGNWGLSMALCVTAGAACRQAPAEGVLSGAAVGVSVQAARLETMRDLIVVPGLVVPASAWDWTIFSPEAGRIAELPKAEGDAVLEGDLLVRFEILSLSQDLSARQLAVSDAIARSETAKGNLARLSPLFDRGIVARNDFEAAKAELAEAEGALTHARAMLEASNKLAENAAIKARFAGIVAKRWHNEGDFVEAQAGDPVIRVIDPGHVQVSAHVSPSQLARIAPGQPATVLPLGSDVGEAATVVTIPPMGAPEGSGGEIRISFAGPTALALDATIRVQVLLSEHESAVVVPEPSVVKAEDGTYVMIAGADGLAHRRDVRIGLIADGLAEVLAGVTPGDRVIVRGLSDVTDGGAIAIER
jgi:RND family efflux transporter MFP subunit